MTDIDIVGKTISKVTKMKAVGYDDSGWLKITFDDNTAVIIQARYGGHTGESLDEYPTDISIIDVGIVNPEIPEEGDENWAWKGLEEVK